ncbi:MAG: FAD-dependent oxidoreductase [Spirochaetes bacterium]|nr:FAD-dependent oxidoreductase [Spirochaetota bacterium]
MFSKYPNIFKPVKIGNLTLKNRITSAPVYNFLASYDNHITREGIEFSKPAGRGGTATVTLGSGFINRVLPPAAHHIVGLNDSWVVPYLSEWCEAVKRFGSKACIELVPIASYFGTHEVESSVGIPMEIDCNLLTTEEIKEFIEDYATSAANVLKAGGDMILLHGAHCQLPSLLFSKVFNRRNDEYGPQSFENRCRFAVEVLDAIRAEVGDSLAIEYRISAIDMIPGSPEIEEVIEFVKAIQDKIDLLHVSRGALALNKLTPFIFPTTYMDHNINIEYAAQFKKALNIPVSVVGAVTLEAAEEAIASGKIDMVALCRQIIADPDTANKLERGQENTIRHCVRCNTCISRSHFGNKPPRCAVNPVFGRELDYVYYPPVHRKKKVVVAGGGPAGMEAARTLAERGHEVVLFEKDSRLGGILRGASEAQFKADLRKYLEWSIRMTKGNKNISLRLSTEVTPEIIDSEKPDALIIATGSIPVVPGLTCSNKSRVILAGDIDNPDAKIGDSILIAGAGLTGCETALKFLMQGKKVTLIDALPQEKIGTGSSPINAYAIFGMLEEYKVDLRCETKLIDVTDDHSILLNNGKEEKLLSDTVIIALGTYADLEAVNRLKNTVAECYIVGDSNGAQGLWNATTSAFDAAMNI